MNILIIGDYPLFFGGVTNYTRPLAQELSTYNNVFYLYNSTRTGNNTFFSKSKIIERVLPEQNYKCYELINGRSVYSNYNNLDNDTNDWFDLMFIDFLKKTKVEVVHINEIFGFSSNIIKICNDSNIKVFVTIHEYWWLCPHRVMVDFNRKICDGPSNLSKCSFCVSNIKNNKNDFFIKSNSKLKHDFPKLHNLFHDFKKSILKSNKQVVNEDLDFLDLDISSFENKCLEIKLENRLKNNISALNSCNNVIAVSEDVRNILCSYGVKEDKIIVQHIGSLIAEKNIPHSKAINKDNIVFGFIGGVGYYKGVHQLVDAYVKLPKEYKMKSSLKIYGKYSQSYYNSIKNKYLTNEYDVSKIHFFGGFTPDQLPDITNQIDISVLPSLCADTAPQTIFESFSSGLPIIAPNIGGFPDFVKSNFNGLIYKAANVMDLRTALITVIDNPETLILFSKNFPHLKTIKENVSELINLYSQSKI